MEDERIIEGDVQTPSGVKEINFTAKPDSPAYSQALRWVAAFRPREATIVNLQHHVNVRYLR